MSIENKEMIYTAEQLQYGFWTRRYRPERRITELKELDGVRNISVNCTQLLIPDREQKRILSEWIEALPHLELDFVEFPCHVPQKLLDALGQSKSIKGVYIKWTKAKFILPLTQAIQLQYLRLGSGAAVQDLPELTRLKNLKALTLDNTKKTNDYSFLRHLAGLEMLEIEGGMYGKIKLDGIDSFIGHLQNLMLFRMGAVSCTKPDVKGLIKLKKLVNLALPFNFTPEEDEILRRGLPDLVYGKEYYDKIIENNLAKLKGLT